MFHVFCAAMGGFSDNIWLNVFFVLAGVVLVLWGADRLTEGAVSLAERMKVSQMVIGLTIVAMGTSMPEFCVSLVSALKGTPDLAVGNVVGSNIFNTLLIVGVAALVLPITILKTTVRKDIPFAVLASAALFLLCLDGNISRVDAGFLLILFFFFMGYTLFTAKLGDVPTAEEKKPMKPLVAAMWLLVGLLCLVFGSNLFVDGATTVAKTMGVSDAIGNVLGSNVFNILFILGVTGVISPMNIQGIGTVDLTVLLGSMVLMWLLSFTKYTISRLEGALLLSCYLAYMTYLIIQVMK